MFNKFTQKLLSLFLFSCAISTLNAEYLVYHLTGNRPEPITSQAEHKEIFDVLMRYQFPMRTNPCLEIEKELSQEEIDLMNKSEQKFLKHLVQTRVNSNLRVLFVPTVLYELFLIRFLFNPSQFKENLKKEDYASEELFLTGFGDFFTNRLLRQRKQKIDDLKNIAASRTKEEYEKQVTALNTSEDLCFAHYILNKHLFSYILDQVNLSDKKLTPETSQEILQKIYADWDEFMKIYDLSKYRLETIANKNIGIHFLTGIATYKKQIVSRAIEIEHEAEKSNSHILYRAAKINESNNGKKYIDCSLNSNYIVSYSSNLFSGSYKDFQTGCSYPIMGFRNHPLGIALFIDKSISRNNLFFIPAYNTLVNTLLGKGEFYHPRSKMTSTQLNGETTGLERHNEPGGNLDLFFQFLTTPLSEEQKDFEYSSFYLLKTWFLVSRKCGFLGNTRNSELEKELLQNHAELAEQLKTRDCLGGEETE